MGNKDGQAAQHRDPTEPCKEGAKSPVHEPAEKKRAAPEPTQSGNGGASPPLNRRGSRGRPGTRDSDERGARRSQSRSSSGERRPPSRRGRRDSSAQTSSLPKRPEPHRPERQDPVRPEPQRPAGARPPPDADDNSDTTSDSGTSIGPRASPRATTARPCFLLGPHLLQTYKEINDKFFEKERAKGNGGPIYNGGYDDAQGNFVVKDGEEINKRYLVQSTIGRGSFGIVVKAHDNHRDKPVALKIIRNKPIFGQQAKLELQLLLHMQAKAHNEHNIIQVLQAFSWKNHMIFVFELLCINLFELLKLTKMMGVSLFAVRKIGYQLLRTLEFLARPDINVIHCDLKPENILLRNPRHSLIKVIDFGSACFNDQRMFQYIQTRFYRAPEVILGLKYSFPIDMWSLGCILVEMHTGQPVFDGKNEIEQLWRFQNVLGPVPRPMLEQVPKEKLAKHFTAEEGAEGAQGDAQPEPKQQLRQPPSGRTGKPGGLADILHLKAGGPPQHTKRPGHDREKYDCFLDLVSKILVYEPGKRMKPEEGLQHVFIRALPGAKEGEGEDVEDEGKGKEEPKAAAAAADSDKKPEEGAAAAADSTD
eukprot:TRINITY_DN475_c1_g2_i1.p1 TRINITY_DN475_c1_g2~~TRINITY_DN475_c1_g2_i1.p1  ORF type:complete len:635 (+),score=194.22 TRINITY_DN475_c1_g2_i1:135-1907(+)